MELYGFRGPGLRERRKMKKYKTCTEFLEKEGLCGLKPRTRCVGCEATVAQLLAMEPDGRYVEQGEWLDVSGDRYVAIDASRQGWMCWPCLEMEEMEPQAVLLLYVSEDAGECWQYKFRIGSHVITEDEEGLAGDMFESVVRAYAQKLSWRYRDAWRGAYIGDFDGEWVKVIDDWFGTIDGHNCDRGDLGKFYDAHEVTKKPVDFPMLVAFPRTSNVCSCGIEVYVKKEDVNLFKRWLKVSELEVVHGV